MARQTNALGKDFSALLKATLITNLGDGLRLAALPLLATTLTTSRFMIAAVTAAQFLPWTVFAPFAGVIVDRSDRRRLILTTQAWRALLMAGLALAVFAEIAHMWHLLVVAFLITAGEILVDPSVVATVPTLVAREDLDEANGRINTAETVTNNFIGSPLGVLCFGIAPWLPFLMDAATYASSNAPFSRLPSSRAQPGPPSSARAEISAGLRWIREHPFLRRLTLGIAVFHLGTGSVLALLVLLVKDVIEAPDGVFAIVLMAAAAGATATSLIAGRLTNRWSRRSVITGAAVIAAASVLAASAVVNPAQLTLAWFVNGAALGVLHSIGRGFVQLHTPNDRLGRVAIASRMLTRTPFVIGALLAGSVASVFSIRGSFVLAGTLHLIGAALVWRSFPYESTQSETLGPDRPGG